jgi:phosphoribosyl 1,2-cyclic phosphodiesterase
VQLAVLAGVRRLFLTHHDPSHDDEFIRGLERKAQQLARSLDSKLEVCCAYEGCEIAV